MYGSYGYGYSTMANTVGIGLVLGFIAFVAAIVVAVLFYKKFNAYFGGFPADYRKQFQAK